MSQRVYMRSMYIGKESDVPTSVVIVSRKRAGCHNVCTQPNTSTHEVCVDAESVTRAPQIFEAMRYRSSRPCVMR
jgi:hypothetical protein